MRKLKISPGEYYHVYNRGSGRQTIFYDIGDYLRFLFLILYFQVGIRFSHIGREVKNFSQYFGKLGQHSVLSNYKNIDKTQSVSLVAFCIMPNHFHIILRENDMEGRGIPIYMQRVLNAYGKYFNTKYNKVGHVFEGPYKAKLIESDEQLMHLSAYIHLNPKDLSGWEANFLNYPWSSLQDYLVSNRWSNLLDRAIIINRYNSSKEYEMFVSESPAKSKENNDFNK